MKIAIVGAAGRMGKMLCALAEGTELEVVSKVDVAEGYDKDWSDDVEGVIDFSYHTAVPPSVAKAAEQQDRSLKEIGIEELKGAGLAGKNDLVKVLGNGEIKTAVTVTANAFSKSAAAAIEAAGGKANVIE